MKVLEFAEAQKAFILKQGEQGTPVTPVTQIQVAFEATGNHHRASTQAYLHARKSIILDHNGLYVT